VRATAHFEHRRRGAVAIVAGLLGLLALAPPAEARAQASLPFFIGEHLTFRLRAGTLGTVGEGTMRVEGPVDVRGRSTYVLGFDFHSRVGPVRVADRTRSWLDPLRMVAMRFEKHERHPLSEHDEAVDLFPAERRWQAEGGRSGRTPTDDPLDELSFLYFIRTLPLAPDAVYTFGRHFETDRNPVTVRVLKRERISVGAGEFPAVLVEMRVRDPRRYRGEGVIRIHLSDDRCRLPLRIESRMPVVGTAVLTLESHTHPRAHFLASPP
jgi:hypothetical protein